MEDTGAASGLEAGGNESATAMPPPQPLPPPINYPLDALGRVRTRGDLATLINAGVDNVTIKMEICGQGYEPMEEDENDVVCVVSLDERNRIISMDDPFQSDENYVEEEDGER